MVDRHEDRVVAGYRITCVGALLCIGSTGGATAQALPLGVRQASILPVALLVIRMFGSLVLAVIVEDRGKPVVVSGLVPSVIITLRTVLLSFLRPRSRP